MRTLQKVLVSIRQAQQKVDAAKRRLSNVEAGRTAAAIQAAYVWQKLWWLWWCAVAWRVMTWPEVACMCGGDGGRAILCVLRQARAYAEQVAYAQRLAAQQAAYATNAQQRSMYQQQVALAQRRAQQQQQ